MTDENAYKPPESGDTENSVDPQIARAQKAAVAQRAILVTAGLHVLLVIIVSLFEPRGFLTENPIPRILMTTLCLMAAVTTFRLSYFNNRLVTALIIAAGACVPCLGVMVMLLTVREASLQLQGDGIPITFLGGLPDDWPYNIPATGSRFQTSMGAGQDPEERR